MTPVWYAAKVNSPRLWLAWLLLCLLALASPAQALNGLRLPMSAFSPVSKRACTAKSFRVDCPINKVDPSGLYLEIKLSTGDTMMYRNVSSFKFALDNGLIPDNSITSFDLGGHGRPNFSTFDWSDRSGTGKNAGGYLYYDKDQQLVQLVDSKNQIVVSDLLGILKPKFKANATILLEGCGVARSDSPDNIVRAFSKGIATADVLGGNAPTTYRFPDTNHTNIYPGGLELYFGGEYQSTMTLGQTKKYLQYKPPGSIPTFSPAPWLPPPVGE